MRRLRRYEAIALCFFLNDTATTEIYTLSLHDALPISSPKRRPSRQTSASRLATSPRWRRDRKSTRLNSSHANISYAVFCLKQNKISRDCPVRRGRTSARQQAANTTKRQ